MKKEFRLSQERKDELEKELYYLKTVRDKEVAEQIKEARSFGDLSENSEYDEAKTEQGKLYSKIAEIENILANCVVIDDTETSSETVSFGCKVTVKFVGDEEEETYQIVGSQEANPMQGRLSEDSPFGKAMLGHQMGDEVIVDAPAGQQHYVIVKIEK